MSNINELLTRASEGRHQTNSHLLRVIAYGMTNRSSEWGSITGDIQDQTDLMELINSLGSPEEIQALQDAITALETQLNDAGVDITNIENTLATIQAGLNEANADIVSLQSAVAALQDAAAAMPSVKTYKGATNASGNYTVTYETPYEVVPDVQCQIVGGQSNDFLTLTSSTTTGFTVNVARRNAVTVLGVEVLLATTTPVSGSNVSVQVTSHI